MAMDPRIAVVIGASSPGGLGEASARRLAGEGYAVVVAGRAEAPLKALANDIGGGRWSAMCSRKRLLPG